MKKHILVIDDDTRVLSLFVSILSQEDFEVTTCSDAHEAESLIGKGRFNLIICDQRLGDLDGIELLTCSQKYAPNMPFIIITGYGTIPLAVESVKKGAFDYIIKPVHKETILKVIRRALQEFTYTIPQSEQALPQPEQAILQADLGRAIIGDSEKIHKLFRVIQQVAKTSATVLIQGESGTGKELIARAIHQMSLRADRPFVAINCGYLSENLLENELFGHIQGAFTGAVRHKKGLLESANEGTIFFDEIGDMPFPVQIKVLRVLQEREFKPLGSNDTIHVDIRVVAATNVDLKEAVAQKKFREDLYYRLAVIPLTVPPLRERKDDIPLLANHFVKKYGIENGKNVESIMPDAMDKLLAYAWPGNVRELENTIARAVALACENAISSDLLWQDDSLEEMILDTTDLISTPEAVSLREIISRDIQSAISEALKLTKGNYSKAARMLGISRGSLYSKIKKYQLCRTKDSENAFS